MGQARSVASTNYTRRWYFRDYIEWQILSLNYCIECISRDRDGLITPTVHRNRMFQLILSRIEITYVDLEITVRWAPGMKEISKHRTFFHTG